MHNIKAYKDVADPIVIDKVPCRDLINKMVPHDTDSYDRPMGESRI